MEYPEKELRNSRTYEEEIDLIDLFKHLWKHWLTILLCTLLGIVAAGLYTRYLVTPLYSSSSLIYIRGTSATITSLSDIQIGSYLSDDYEVIFKSRTVMEKVISRLKLTDVTAKQLSGMVSVSNDSGRNILEVSATTPDPSLSRDIVNAVVDYGVDIVKEINTKEPYIIERAIANSQKVSPSMFKNVAIGGMLGLLLAAGVYVIIYLTNDRIESVETIESKLGIPVIGSVPASESLTYSKSLTRKKHRKKKKDGEVLDSVKAYASFAYDRVKDRIKSTKRNKEEGKK